VSSPLPIKNPIWHTLWRWASCFI